MILLFLFIVYCFVLLFVLPDTQMLFTDAIRDEGCAMQQLLRYRGWLHALGKAGVMQYNCWDNPGDYPFEKNKIK